MYCPAPESKETTKAPNTKNKKKKTKICPHLHPREKLGRSPNRASMTCFTNSLLWAKQFYLLPVWP